MSYNIFQIRTHPVRFVKYLNKSIFGNKYNKKNNCIWSARLVFKMYMYYIASGMNNYTFQNTSLPY